VGAEEFAHVGFFEADAVEDAGEEEHGEGACLTAWTLGHRRIFMAQTFSSDAFILTPAEALAGANGTSMGWGLGGRGGIGG
jgi:hypothetical protein